MRNTVDYEYVVFYYDMDELAKSSILKDLYAHKMKGADGKDTTDDALSTQETDFIEPVLREAADEVAELLGRWMRCFSMTNQDGTAYYPDIYGITGYEYGKQNIDPDNDSPGNYIVYRVYFPETQQQTMRRAMEQMSKVDSQITRYLTAKVLREWALITGQVARYQTAEILLSESAESIVASMTFRHTPPLIKYVNF